MQTQVNIKQAIGTIGTWVNDALKSAVAYVVKGTNGSAAVAATGSIEIDNQPTAAEKVVVNGVDYTFVSGTPATPYEVEIGASAAATATNLAAAINATSPFFSGVASSAVVALTARQAGVVGNDYTLSTDSENITITDMSGGVDAIAGTNATIGRAFTLDADGSSAVMGGTGAFLGIFVNPHKQAIYNGLVPTLSVPDGVSGAMAKSGYIFVALANDANVGDGVFFTNATGVLSAGTASTGQTQIKGCQVVVGGTAGSVVKIGFIPQV